MPTIARVTAADLQDLLALMRAYCDFYGAHPPDEAQLALARALLEDPDHAGLQLIARDGGEGAAIGFATLFWTFDTLRASEIGLMNDLYVVPAARRAGLGRALIAACAECCRRRGVRAMDWQTAPENATAQRLYETLGAEREDAVVYALAL